MHRIIECGVSAHASLKSLGASVDLTEKLQLKPTVPRLHGVHGSLSSCEFGNPDEAYRGDKVDEALRNPHERADLSDRLQSPTVDRRDPREVGVKGHGDLRAQDVTHPSDACRIAFSHRRTPDL